MRGLVVPDLPLEEAEVLLRPASDVGVEVTMLVAPTSPKERLEDRPSLPGIYLLGEHHWRYRNAAHRRPAGQNYDRKSAHSYR